MVSLVRLFILAGGGQGGGLGSSSTQSFTPHLQLLHVHLLFILFYFDIYSLYFFFCSKNNSRTI